MSNWAQSDEQLSSHNFEWLLIKTFMTHVLQIFSYGFGYGLRPKAEVFQGQTFSYGRKWKLRLRSNTAIDKDYIQIALIYCKRFKWRQLYSYYKSSYGSWFIDKKCGAQPLFKFFFWNSMINSKLESPLCSVI